jgi:glycosyl hydrolase family 26
MCLLPAAAAATPAAKVLPPRHGIYHAAFPDFCPEEDCVSAERIRAFEQLAGKRIAWAYFSDNWFDGIEFPAEKVRAIWSVHHTIPFIRLMARANWDEGCADKTYALAKIAAGRFDAQLRAYARSAAETAIPLMIEFGTEANGNWFPWSGACNGGPARFRAAWRHVVSLFRAEGASNVTWVLHLDAQGEPAARWNRLAAYYPGDRWVDWVGLSAYGPQQPGDPWESFRSVFAPAYRELAAAAPRKPIALLEFGAIAEDGGDKAAWIAAALHDVASGRYPRLKAVSYWSSNWTNDGTGPSIMRIDSSPAVLAAYRAGIRTPAFVSAPRLSSSA